MVFLFWFMDTPTIEKVIPILREKVKTWPVPIITLIAQTKKDPFLVLIGTVLSLRTKDEVTAQACKRLFAKADTPEKMLKLSEEEIEKIIYPVGFYRIKSRNILKICLKLTAEFNSIVPDEIDTLLTFPNVGRKTANLVLSDGYGKPAMCVDVHVNRISNRFGYVKTKNPEETEYALRDKLPVKYWIEYNFILVAFGQYLCRPISPKCSECPIIEYCERVGVIQSR
jgi:endonuclease III